MGRFRSSGPKIWLFKKKNLDRSIDLAVRHIHSTIIQSGMPCIDPYLPMLPTYHLTNLSWVKFCLEMQHIKDLRPKCGPLTIEISWEVHQFNSLCPVLHFQERHKDKSRISQRYHDISPSLWIMQRLVVRKRPISHWTTQFFLGQRSKVFAFHGLMQP